MRAPLTAVAVLLLLAGCGSVSGIGTPAATASSVAVKSSDLPSDLHRCNLSGDINDYLKKIQTKDPITYSTIKGQWAAAQKDGATAADVEFYTDSAAHKLVVNFVFQFKDQASAEKGYSTDSIFGFSAPTLKGSQVPVTEGTATGLGKNSIVLSISISNQAFYVAVWQNKQFMVILGILNIDTGADKKIALAENGRIH